MRTFYILKCDKMSKQATPVIIDIINTKHISEAKIKFKNIDYEQGYKYELIEQVKDKLLVVMQVGYHRGNY